MSSTVDRAAHQPLSPTSDASVAAPVRRRAKGFYVAMALLMTGFVIAGFWRSYVGPYVTGREVQVQPVIHLHGLVFFGWMLLLLTQTGLVYRGRQDLHKRIGRVGIAYGVAVLAMGFVASIAGPVMRVHSGEWTLDRAAGFIILPLGDMVLFGTLFGAAIAARRHLEAHKRLILLATIALLFAPAARLVPQAYGPAILLGVWLAPLVIAMGYDVWSRRRVHPAYIAGTGVLLVGFTRVLAMESESWLRIGRAIVSAFL